MINVGSNDPYLSCFCTPLKVAKNFYCKSLITNKSSP